MDNTERTGLTTSQVIGLCLSFAWLWLTWPVVLVALSAANNRVMPREVQHTVRSLATWGNLWLLWAGPIVAFFIASGYPKR